MNKLTKLMLGCAWLLACGDDENPVNQQGPMDGGPHLDGGGDGGHPHLDSGFDASDDRTTCGAYPACQDGNAKVLNLCWHRTTEIPSGGFIARCLVGPDSQLYLIVGQDDQLVTTSGWTADGYEPLAPSTLSAADEARCEDAKNHVAAGDGGANVCSAVAGLVRP